MFFLQETYGTLQGKYGKNMNYKKQMKIPMGIIFPQEKYFSKENVIYTGEKIPIGKK